MNPYYLKHWFLAALLQMAGLSLYSQVVMQLNVEENYPAWVDVHVKVHGFTDMVSMQFSLSYDPAEATFSGSMGFNLPGMTPSNIGNPGGPASGMISVSWLAVDVVTGQDSPDGTTIFTLRFVPLIPGGCSFLYDPEFPVPVEFSSTSGFGDVQFIDCGYGGGLLSGKVFADQNADCDYTAGEPTLPYFTVEISGDGDTSYAFTTSGGVYFYPFQQDDETLTVSVISPNGYWAGCAPFEQVEVSDPTVSQTLDLGMNALDDCMQLKVEIGANILRRCFQSTYLVSYCNLGTLPVAGAEVVIDFDPFLEVISSTLPWSGISGNTYTFPIGDLDIGECGFFEVSVLVSCSAVLGQTHCTEAAIYPVEFCDPAPEWDGAQLAVKGNCTGEEVQFEIRNIGQQAMGSASDYIVIEDDMIKNLEPIGPLGPDEFVELQFPANGSTWRVEVAQVPDFPAPSEPSATVEACDEDGDGDFSLGFVSMLPQDENAPYVAVDCRENVGSYDPNDKSAFPAGYRETHLVTPETRLEYRIRFQNTGSDTAFNVIIRDTLSAWLDPVSVRLQATSHPCDLVVLDDRTLLINFPGILLPDTTTNEPASHGFVQFSVDQMPGNPLGEVIENRAAIYFDYNVPVITNETFHTIGEDFIADTDGVFTIPWQAKKLLVSPNPADGQVRVWLEGIDGVEGQLRVYDQTGRLVEEMVWRGKEMVLPQGLAQQGIYYLVLFSEEKIIGIGKVVVK